eukprot:CAMPEP_0119055522 /NCGR_PEP_ID=MMETSP1177-20130426/75762_1 /TAXON_ID=2985 /ORGANISM="Ochromonas sp, Strain CCMP1899" /LENGTH=277 /DNA_ID=CAMNT_0007036063 /DNA_START=884 /DNA_END=1714 /DNA_ORIENTATION=-
MRSDPLITVVQDHYDTSSIKRASSGCVADILISICTYIVTVDENHRKERLQEFSRELMSAPLLTLLLSLQGLKSFTKWEFLIDVFRFFLSPNLALPPSSHEVFQSGQWVSGNIASLAPFIEINPKNSIEIPDLNDKFEYKNENIEVSHIDGDVKNGNITDEYIEIYILLIISLLRRFNIPGVLQGNQGIVWIKNGATLTAANVPVHLREQILSLLDPVFTKGLYERILLPLRDDIYGRGLSLQSDKADIAEALSVSGLQIVQTVITDQQEAATWFTS